MRINGFWQSYKLMQLRERERAGDVEGVKRHFMHLTHQTAPIHSVRVCLWAIPSFSVYSFFVIIQEQGQRDRQNVRDWFRTFHIMRTLSMCCVVSTTATSFFCIGSFDVLFISALHTWLKNNGNLHSVSAVKSFSMGHIFFIQIIQLRVNLFMRRRKKH